MMVIEIDYINRKELKIDKYFPLLPLTNPFPTIIFPI